MYGVYGIPLDDIESIPITKENKNTTNTGNVFFTFEYKYNMKSINAIKIKTESIA